MLWLYFIPKGELIGCLTSSTSLLLVISEMKYTPADKYQIKKTCFSNLIKL